MLQRPVSSILPLFAGCILKRLRVSSAIISISKPEAKRPIPASCFHPKSEKNVLLEVESVSTDGSLDDARALTAAKLLKVSTKRLYPTKTKDWETGNSYVFVNVIQYNYVPIVEVSAVRPLGAEETTNMAQYGHRVHADEKGLNGIEFTVACSRSDRETTGARSHSRETFGGPAVAEHQILKWYTSRSIK